MTQTQQAPSKPILICGVGALGSHVAMALRNHPGGLVLLDMDRVESKNALNQVYPRGTAGKLKADTLRQVLLSCHGVTARALSVELRANNVAELITPELGLVVDCFDNYAARALAAERARTASVPVLHAGISADASAGLVSWTLPEDQETPGVATCTDPTVLPAHTLVAALAARAVMEFLAAGQRVEYRLAGSRVYSSSRA